MEAVAGEYAATTRRAINATDRVFNHNPFNRFFQTKRASRMKENIKLLEKKKMLWSSAKSLY